MIRFAECLEEAQNQLGYTDTDAIDNASELFDHAVRIRNTMIRSCIPGVDHRIIALAINNAAKMSGHIGSDVEIEMIFSLVEMAESVKRL